MAMYAVVGASTEAPSQEDLSTTLMFSKPDNNNNNNSNNNNNPLNLYREYNMSCTTDLNQSQPSTLSYGSAQMSFLDTLLDSDGGFQKLLSSGDTEYDPMVVKEESEFSPSGSFSGFSAVENGDMIKYDDPPDVKEENEFSPSGSFPTCCWLKMLIGIYLVDATSKKKHDGFAKRLNDQIHFSSGKFSSSRYMPQIAKNENEHLEICNSSNVFCAPSFENDFLNETSISDIKRSSGDEDKFSGFNAIDNQNKNNTSYPGRLTHHLSLPKTSGEVASMEKYLQFQQEAVPCKIRAKRGFATHPRSIAERMRRTRISERMKKLQDLFPDMDKQTNTADMLDLAVEYIKNLENQVQTLTSKRAKCSCIK